MSQLATARRQLSSIKSLIRQEKFLSAVQTLRDAVITVFREPLMKAEKEEFDVVFACGPTPMLKAAKALGERRGVPCFLSLEERMACGIGACLACVCKSKEVDAHTNVHNKRVCKDGPVFRAEEVEL